MKNQKGHTRLEMLAILAILILTSSFLITGCPLDPSRQATGTSTKAEMQLTEVNHQRLMEAQPAPLLNTSLERENLIKYLEYWNSAERVSYIYLISNTGAVIANYTIVGKITYCSSKLTTRDQIVRTYSSGGGPTQVIESPGLDGSYGPSEDAIFFFTQQAPDVPIVWKGSYLVSGIPLSISTPPILILDITNE